MSRWLRALLIIGGALTGAMLVWEGIIVFFPTAMSIDAAIGYMWLGLFAGGAAAWWATGVKSE